MVAGRPSCVTPSSVPVRFPTLGVWISGRRRRGSTSANVSGICRERSGLRCRWLVQVRARVNGRLAVGVSYFGADTSTGRAGHGQPAVGPGTGMDWSGRARGMDRSGWTWAWSVRAGHGRGVFGPGTGMDRSDRTRQAAVGPGTGVEWSSRARAWRPLASTAWALRAEVWPSGIPSACGVIRTSSRSFPARLKAHRVRVPTGAGDGGWPSAPSRARSPLRSVGFDPSGVLAPQPLISMRVCRPGRRRGVREPIQSFHNAVDCFFLP